MIGFTEHWNQYLESIPVNQQDLYFREEYVRLYETERVKKLVVLFSRKT